MYEFFLEHWRGIHAVGTLLIIFLGPPSSILYDYYSYYKKYKEDLLNDTGLPPDRPEVFDPIHWIVPILSCMLWPVIIFVIPMYFIIRKVRKDKPFLRYVEKKALSKVPKSIILTSKHSYIRSLGEKEK